MAAGDDSAGSGGGLSDLEVHEASQVVRRYEHEHPGVVGGVRIEQEAVRRVRVLLWDDDRRHERALRGLVAHPELLVVEPMAWSPSYLETVRAVIHEMATTGAQGEIRRWGPGWGVVQATLAADQEPLAAELHARFGSAVSLTLGAFPYPRDRPATWQEQRVATLQQQRSRQPIVLPEEIIVPGLELRLELLTPQVRSGADGAGRLWLTNAGRSPLGFLTGPTVPAETIDPESGETVGRWVGSMTAVGRRIDLAAGDRTDIRVLVATTSIRPELGYSLPPGEYLARVQLPVNHFEGARGPNRRVVTVPPAPFTIVG